VSYALQAQASIARHNDVPFIFSLSVSYALQAQASIARHNEVLVKLTTAQEKLEKQVGC